MSRAQRPEAVNDSAEPLPTTPLGWVERVEQRAPDLIPGYTRGDTLVYRYDDNESGGAFSCTLSVVGHGRDRIVSIETVTDRRREAGLVLADGRAQHWDLSGAGHVGVRDEVDADAWTKAQLEGLDEMLLYPSYFTVVPSGVRVAA